MLKKGTRVIAIQELQMGTGEHNGPITYHFILKGERGNVVKADPFQTVVKFDNHEPEYHIDTQSVSAALVVPEGH